MPAPRPQDDVDRLVSELRRVRRPPLWFYVREASLPVLFLLGLILLGRSTCIACIHPVLAFLYLASLFFATVLCFPPILVYYVLVRAALWREKMARRIAGKYAATVCRLYRAVAAAVGREKDRYAILALANFAYVFGNARTKAAILYLTRGKPPTDYAADTLAADMERYGYREEASIIREHPELLRVIADYGGSTCRDSNSGSP